MILDLIAHWPVDAAASVMVGDKEIDVEAGRAAGIAAEIVRSGELEGFVDRFLRRTAQPMQLSEPRCNAGSAVFLVQQDRAIRTSRRR